MKTPTSRLSRSIKRAGEQKTITQGYIRRMGTLDRTQISNIEVGKDNHTLAAIEKIAQALGASF
jgi:transcriptional regulator with XRE-family HTH domain